MPMQSLTELMNGGVLYKPVGFAFSSRKLSVSYCRISMGREYIAASGAIEESSAMEDPVVGAISSNMSRKWRQRVDLLHNVLIVSSL